MSETESIETTARAADRSLVGRLRFWLRAEREIHELTRDREHEDRVYDAAAVHLAPGPWQIAQLFRRRR